VDDLEQALRSVRLVVFDFDGVFTDNRVWVDEDGRESVACCRADGFGLRRLAEVGVEALIVTTESVPVASVRARKLEVQCIQGADDKLAILHAEVERRGVALEETAFVGNDVNDAACLEAVGVPIVPADAWPEVKGLARWVLERRGGEGCVREVCDEIARVRRGAA
jgi:3-deoxy-D-manno-octulosonate 8-phosphate phosphatase (KDO 8-P phosphatase)